MQITLIFTPSNIKKSKFPNVWLIFVVGLFLTSLMLSECFSLLKQLASPSFDQYY